MSDGDWVETRDQDPKGQVRLIQLADIGDGEFRNRSNRFLTKAKAGELDCTYLRPGDILIARMPDPLGRACIFPDLDQPCVTAVDVCIVRPGAGSVSPQWLMHTLNAPETRLAIARYQSGSTRKRISKSNLGNITFPVPPLLEQHRIVEAIESYLTRLDAAVATLERVKANLKRYRASVLQAAVEGRLVTTEAELARKEGRDYEPASVLLDRILKERRRRWEEAELAKLTTMGKTRKDDGSKRRYQEPCAPDVVDLPQLPEGWCWTTAEALSDETRSITYGIIKLGPEIPGGVPTLRSSDVRSLHLDDTDVKRISRTIADNYRRTYLLGGEVLITVRGTLGGVVVAPQAAAGFNISREVAMLALVEPALGPIVATLIASPMLQGWLLRRTKGIAYRGVNIETLKRLPIPVPPRAEQCRIVAHLERHLSVGTSLWQDALRDGRRCEVLRRSILRLAFEGGLVEQDPTDEPASVLLERIRAERQTIEAEGSGNPPKSRQRRTA
jgi:type I restriction enzyme S subunit